MNLAKCMQLFVLIAQVTDAEPYRVLVEAAAEEVRSELRPDADPTDEKLCYYCAAIAHLRYTQIIASRSTLSHTYAGTLDKAHDDRIPCGFAERLVAEFRAAASHLLLDRSFVFTGIS